MSKPSKNVFKNLSRPTRTLLLAACVAILVGGLTFAATSWAHPVLDASTPGTSPSHSPLALLTTGPAPFQSGTDLGDRLLEHVASRLELTDAQRDEIRRLAFDQGPEIVEAVRQVKDCRVELFEAIHEHPPFEVEIRDASVRLSEAQTVLALLRAGLADDIHGVLTPAQQDELEGMKQNLRTLLEIAADGLTDRLAARLSA